MTSTFIQHELKAFWRSKNTGKNVAVRIVMGILILILFLYVLAIGLLMDKLIDGLFPNEDLIVSFSGIILLYFMVDLIMRFQLQELPTLRVQPYLLLPIPRNTVCRYLSLASLQSIFNLWPVMLFFPFIFKIIKPELGLATALLFVVSITGFTIFNNYLSLFVKRKANLNGWIFIGFAAGLTLLAMADFNWHLFSISKISFLFFGHLAKQPLLVLIPLLLAVIIYYINFSYLKQNLYVEELGSKKETYKSSTEISLLGRFGKVGDLVANEVKLILRNKRSSSALKMTTIFLLYGLLFYTNKIYGDGWKIFCGMFMTGIFIINYGQFMFGWQAGHFDGILVSKTSFKDFLKAKYLLFTGVSSVAFLLTLPYAYFGWYIIVYHFAMYLWNIGVNTTIVLYFANRNYKRIDLSKGASFNWEGVGATQLLIGFPLFITPFIIYAPLAWFAHPGIALFIIAGVGVVFMLTRNWWLQKLETDFYEKKYTIAEGFRAK